MLTEPATRGGVVQLDPIVANAILRSLIRDLRAQVRNGAPVPSWAQEVLPYLAAIADSPVDGADIGTAVGTVKTTDWLQMVPIDEAAQQVGVSQTYVRRLARQGRVLSRRINGKAWVVDLDSVRRVTGRAA